MEKIFTVPNKLDIDISSYRFLAKLQYDIYACHETSIILSFDNCSFTHAAFTAYFGALITVAQKWGKDVSIFSKNNLKILDYFKKSGLYEYYTTLQHFD